MMTSLFSGVWIIREISSVPSCSLILIPRKRSRRKNGDSQLLLLVWRANYRMPAFATECIWDIWVQPGFLGIFQVLIFSSETWTGPPLNPILFWNLRTRAFQKCHFWLCTPHSLRENLKKQNLIFLLFCLVFGFSSQLWPVPGQKWYFWKVQILSFHTHIGPRGGGRWRKSFKKIKEIGVWCFIKIIKKI